jgi:AcrR family transcriptional regulator
VARAPYTEQERAEQGRQQQARILDGLAACIREKGYAATTISDIARAASVSKSTVYTHYADKEDCFLALYSAASDNLLAVMARAHADAQEAQLPWREHLRAVFHAYLTAIAAGGAVARCCLVEVQAVGPAALELRREVLDRYARLLCRGVDELRKAHPELRPLTADLALSVLGGVNEHMLRTVETRGAPELADVTDAATDLMCAVLTSGPVD